MEYSVPLPSSQSSSGGGWTQRAHRLVVRWRADKYYKGEHMMVKVKEIVEAVQKQPAQIQPSLVKKQGRIGKVVAQIAASDAQLPPNSTELAMAHMQYSQMKRRNDALYAQRLKQQAGNAQAFVAGRRKR